jgi:hypothetical protein
MLKEGEKLRQFSAAVATSREGHRSPRSGPAGQRQRLHQQAEKRAEKRRHQVFMAKLDDASATRKVMGVPGQVPTLWQGISPGSLERIVATARSIVRSTYAPHRNLGIGLHHIPGASGFPGRAPGACS